MTHMMHIFSQNIDFLQEHNVLFHDSSVFLLVHILIFLEHLTKVVDTVFEIFSTIGILTVDIEISIVIFKFFVYIFFEKVNRTTS
jgi:hypothetical protein